MRGRPALGLVVLGAGLLWMVMGEPERAGALDLPALGWLLAGGDPLAAFPDSLPAHVGLWATLDAREFLHLSEGRKRQDYSAWDGATLLLARARFVVLCSN